MNWEQRHAVKAKLEKLKKPVVVDGKIEVDVHDLHGKVVIIYVEDPTKYQQEQGAWTARFLKGAGAASVIVCRSGDKIDVLSDDELASLGLKRLEQ